jgi:hypothetical protein
MGEYCATYFQCVIESAITRPRGGRAQGNGIEIEARLPHGGAHQTILAHGDGTQSGGRLHGEATARDVPVHMAQMRHAAQAIAAHILTAIRVPHAHPQRGSCGGGLSVRCLQQQKTIAAGTEPARAQHLCRSRKIKRAGQGMGESIKHHEIVAGAVHLDEGKRTHTIHRRMLHKWNNDLPSRTTSMWPGDRAGSGPNRDGRDYSSRNARNSVACRSCSALDFGESPLEACTSPLTFSSRRRNARRKAWTICGSNWVPEHRSISAMAA